MTQPTYTEKRKRGRWFRDFWTITKPYWFSEEKWTALVLLATVVGLSLASVYALVVFNTWNQEFYDALQNMNAAAFPKLMGKFSIIAGIYILLVVYKSYLGQLLKIRWRRWMTKDLLGTYLNEKTYYLWELTQRSQTDNPDQRIAEDIWQFVNITMMLVLDLLSQVVTLFSFIFVLWQISGPISFMLFNKTITIQGYMVWACLFYCLVGSLVTHFLGRTLVALRFDQQRKEANFRFSLVRLRENSESVALCDGAPAEIRSFDSKMADIVKNFHSIIDTQKRLTFFTVFFNQFANIFPILVAAPRYFSQAIKLGGLMQIANAFGRVQDALSFIVNSYTEIAEWRAVTQRLATFIESIGRAKNFKQQADTLIESHSKDSFELKDIALTIPDGTQLVNGVNLSITKGSSLLITGDSGTGKSTLFRTIAGIWPFAKGKIQIPSGVKAMVLPQKPYLPIDSLKAALTYPENPTKFSDAEVTEVMKLCKLDKFIERLHDVDSWAIVLSPGEQQRTSFARVFLHKPDWLFLDESTSALDESTQKHMYLSLKKMLPGVSIISIAHRLSIQEFHEKQFHLQK